MSNANPSLYARIGGKGAVDAAVEIFYKRVLADERIRHFFDTVNMSAQIGKQKKFLAFAFGGPVKYDGKDLREGHRHMKLNDAHFDAVAENLQATLEQLQVPADLVGQVMSIAAGTRNDVLNRDI